jgi:hypothetical protein
MVAFLVERRKAREDLREASDDSGKFKRHERCDDGGP